MQVAKIGEMDQRGTYCLLGAQRQERLACRKEYVQVKRLDACFVFFASAVGKTVQGAYLELNI